MATKETFQLDLDASEFQSKLGTALKGLDKLEDQADKTGRAVADIGDKSSVGMNLLTGAVAGGTAALVNFAGQGLGKALERMVELGSETDSLGGKFEELKDIGDSILKALLPTMEALVDITLNLADEVEALIDAFDTSTMESNNELWNNLVALFDELMELVDPISSAFLNLWDVLSDLGIIVGTVSTKFLTWFTDALQPIYDFVVGKLTIGFNALAGALAWLGTKTQAVIDSNEDMKANQDAVNDTTDKAVALVGRLTTSRIGHKKAIDEDKKAAKERADEIYKDLLRELGLLERVNAFAALKAEEDRLAAANEAKRRQDIVLGIQEIIESGYTPLQVAYFENLDALEKIDSAQRQGLITEEQVIAAKIAANLKLTKVVEEEAAKREQAEKAAFIAISRAYVTSLNNISGAAGTLVDVFGGVSEESSKAVKAAFAIQQAAAAASIIVSTITAMWLTMQDPTIPSTAAKIVLATSIGIAGAASLAAVLATTVGSTGMPKLFGGSAGGNVDGSTQPGSNGSNPGPGASVGTGKPSADDTFTDTPGPITARAGYNTFRFSPGDMVMASKSPAGLGNQLGGIETLREARNHTALLEEIRDLLSMNQTTSRHSFIGYRP